MDKVVLGKTGIEVNKNGFGALPIQRISKKDAVYLLQKAFYHGVDYFDTARAYSDSEEKMGAALCLGQRPHCDQHQDGGHRCGDLLEGSGGPALAICRRITLISISSIIRRFAQNRGMAPASMRRWKKPKQQGKIRHIGITNHRLAVAREAIESGLYETLQFPFSYLASGKDREISGRLQGGRYGLYRHEGTGGRADPQFSLRLRISGTAGILPMWRRSGACSEKASWMSSCLTRRIRPDCPGIWKQ